MISRDRSISPAISDYLQARGAALASTPTAEMRAALAAAGTALPDVAALHSLSATFNKRLEQSRHRIGGTRARDTAATKEAVTWHQLFVEVEVDGSSFVTFC